jgi:hypothetical protein
MIKAQMPCRSGISRVTDIAFPHGLGGMQQCFVDVFPVTRLI